MNRWIRTGLILGACVMSAIAVLVLVHSLTQKRIENTQQKWLSDSLYALLPEGPFDNNPIATVKWLSVAELGSSDPVPVYTVYQNQTPYAAVLTVSTHDGYNGEIQLLLGLNFNGTIIGARVTHHSETPGLGDDIELRRSDWITGFNKVSLSTTGNNDWTVKQAGGKFDAFTGATITPRAVIQAIHRALQWYEVNRHLVFTT